MRSLTIGGVVMVMLVWFGIGFVIATLIGKYLKWLNSRR